MPDTNGHPTLPQFDTEDDLEFVTEPDARKMVEHQKMLESRVAVIESRQAPQMARWLPPRWLCIAYALVILLLTTCVPWRVHPIMETGAVGGRGHSLGYHAIWSPPLRQGSESEDRVDWASAYWGVVRFDTVQWSAAIVSVTVAAACVWVASSSLERKNHNSEKKERSCDSN